MKTHDQITALIVDDEVLSRDVVRFMLKRHFDVKVVEECSNGEEALQAIKEHRPQLIFLDIKMPGIDGFKLKSKISEVDRPFIVFITAYSEYAIKAFDVDALDYLLKPFDQERFDQMLNRVRMYIDQKNNADFGKRMQSVISDHSRDLYGVEKQIKPVKKVGKTIDRLVIKEEGRLFFVNPQEVDWFEASGNYVCLHMGAKKHLIYGTLTQLEEKLDANCFIRIHRSTIVNIDQIKELLPHFNGEYLVYLKDGTELKLSRSYKDKARLAFDL